VIGSKSVHDQHHDDDIPMVDLVDKRFENEKWNLTEQLIFPLAAVGLLVWLASEAFASWAADAERKHHRAELLAAYRRRAQWKNRY
jgi:hypothetical protein